MVTLYIYDLIHDSKNPRENYKIKRKFYYSLSKLNNFSFLSKSVILTNDEEFFDSFFKEYNGRIICFKVKTNQIDKVI